MDAVITSLVLVDSLLHCCCVTSVPGLGQSPLMLCLTAGSALGAVSSTVLMRDTVCLVDCNSRGHEWEQGRFPLEFVSAHFGVGWTLCQRDVKPFSLCVIQVLW